jgi:hypothetical protein
MAVSFALLLALSACEETAKAFLSSSQLSFCAHVPVSALWICQSAGEQAVGC